MGIATVEFRCDSLNRTTEFRAYIPDDLAPGQKLKTLYLLHGANGCNSDWLNYTRIALWARQRNLAVIMPNGENSFYVEEKEGRSFYSKYICEDLLNYTRNLFPLSDKREDTFICGISMGGYGAAALGLHYTEIYAKIALFSPALEADTLLLNAPEGIMPPGLFPALFGNREAYASSPRLNPFRGVRDALDSGRMLPGVWMCCGEEDLIPADAISILSSSMMQPKLLLFSSPV